MCTCVARIIEVVHLFGYQTVHTSQAHNLTSAKKSPPVSRKLRPAPHASLAPPTPGSVTDNKGIGLTNPSVPSACTSRPVLTYRNFPPLLPAHPAALSAARHRTSSAIQLTSARPRTPHPAA